MDKPIKTTAERLAEALSARNMKAVELHEKTGISKPSISQYISGKVTPKQDRIYIMAKALNVDTIWLMGYDVPMERKPIAELYSGAGVLKMNFNDLLKSSSSASATPSSRQGIRIPVLGRVVAGIPIEAITDIIDYEEIAPDLAKTGDFFALHVQGSSMEPKLYDGDVVIVRRQPTVESGETAIVLVNGNDATVKQVKEVDAGIMLIGHNTAVYEPHFYSQQEISDLPVQILGKVVELRRKF